MATTRPGKKIEDEDYVDFGVRFDYKPLPKEAKPQPRSTGGRTLSPCDNCGRTGYLIDRGYRKVCAYGGCGKGYY